MFWGRCTYHGGQMFVGLCPARGSDSITTIEKVKGLDECWGTNLNTRLMAWISKNGFQLKSTMTTRFAWHKLIPMPPAFVETISSLTELPAWRKKDWFSTMQRLVASNLFSWGKAVFLPNVRPETVSLQHNSGSSHSVIKVLAATDFKRYPGKTFISMAAYAELWRICTWATKPKLSTKPNLT